MSVADIFADGGGLSRQMSDYQKRGGQIEMAAAVESALAGGCHVLEAGTGIGKTFSYLAPIIENGLSAVISTGTRALQDQLFLRDIPFLAKVLNHPVNAAILKGRANYICRRNLLDDKSQIYLSDDGDGQWQKLIRFAAQSDDGDIRDAPDIPAASNLWAAATSTRESCTVQKCAHYENCFLYRARARARAADIVIVNHHLFLSDMRLREEGVAEIVPTRDVLLFDEAHLLPPLSTQYFGESVSTAQLIKLAHDGEKIIAAHAKNAASLLPLARRLRAMTDAVLQVADNFGENNFPRDKFCEDAKTVAAAVADVLQKLAGGLIDNAADDEKIATLAARVLENSRKWNRWFNGDDEKNVNSNEESGDEESGGEEKVPTLSWAQKRDGNLTFNTAPLSGRNIFRRQWTQTRCAIFTSATLSVDGGFNNFCEEMGLANDNARSWQSPFDFANRALLYLPQNMPDPNSEEYTRATVEIAAPLIRANRGRAFVLFTSLRALNKGAGYLKKQLGKKYKLIKQGDMSNDECLQRFRKEKNCILAGSLSFWQGVDVKGEALSLVVVDKIPFTSPDDPILKARDKWRATRGENAFIANQLPPAVILMKQVAGRLMRDFADRGALVFCDPRLQTRGYGKTILNSLPPMKRCYDGEAAADFLRRGDSGGDA